mmetsp:Transcript_5027/g.10987  ORF Transcript_5027/g.10987 Transcript_5027/m.10987 type:complete len:492 (-) Transcript_5027:17-1492(-)
MTGKHICATLTFACVMLSLRAAHAQQSRSQAHRTQSMHDRHGMFRSTGHHGRQGIAATQAGLMRRKAVSEPSAPRVAAADAVRFRAWIDRQQFPHDCSRAVGVVTREDYFFSLGLGSQMVSLKFNLLDALLRRKVYHFPRSHYVNPVRCPSTSFECYFEPVTNCSVGATPPQIANLPVNRSTHASVENSRLLWCFAVPRRRLTSLAGLEAVHGSDWYHAQLAAFLFRPNEAIREFRRIVAPQMDFAGGKASGEAPSNQSSCAAMHIRRTDKHTEDHRTKERPWTSFSHSFKTWAYWQSDKQPAHIRVLLGSEDKATFSTMPPLLAPAISFWIPARFFVMDMSENKRFVNIKQSNALMLELYGKMEDSAAASKAQGSARAGAATAANGPGVASFSLADEGMALILQILLMAECDAFFGSYSSNVAILVHDLMLAQATVTGERRDAFDVNGRVYCGCGASFCMRLEKRAAREPARAIKHMVDAFHGDNVWAVR